MCASCQDENECLRCDFLASLLRCEESGGQSVASGLAASVGIGSDRACCMSYLDELIPET